MTPQKKIYEGEAGEIILPGEDGEFSVMDFHQPCLYVLRSGNIKIEEKLFSIKSGVAKVESNALKVMAEA